MQIKRTNGLTALCEAHCIEIVASLLMMREDNLRVGDYVIISVGNIISRLDKKSRVRVGPVR